MYLAIIIDMLTFFADIEPFRMNSSIFFIDLAEIESSDHAQVLAMQAFEDAGLIFILLWQLPRGQSETFYFVYFLVGSILFYMGYTVFATPWVALGYELTPDYHERTRLMGTQNFIGQLAYVVSPWFLWIMNSGTFFRNAAGEPES